LLPKYTATKMDRDGITVSCQDIVHSNWNNEDIYKSITVIPKCM